MTRSIATMFLSFLVAISVHSKIANSDYIPPKLQVIEATPIASRTEFKLMVVDAFPNDAVMVRIANAESGFNPKAKNSNSTAKGLFQILDSTWKSNGCIGDVYNPVDNIACAKLLYTRNGTHPWLASKSGWE